MTPKRIYVKNNRFKIPLHRNMTKPFHQTIGIVGGGQLGKMLIEAARGWNIPFAVLDPSPSAPASHYTGKFIQGSLTSREKIRELAAVSDILTFEIEHIDVQTLIELKGQGKKVIPDPEILRIIQDKGLQKLHYERAGLPTATFVLAENKEEAIDALSGFTGDRIVIKSRRGGYDGRGVAICNINDLLSGKEAFPFAEACVLEEYFEEVTELSVIVARDSKGNVVTFPVAEMVFDPRINLVDYLFAPARISEKITEGAIQISMEAVSAMDGVGLFAVELFMDANGNIFINEIAPRPHNSGHHTIEAGYCSQYEQLLRILLDMPLGSGELRSPAVMVNIIGPEHVSGKYDLEGVDDFLAEQGVYLHMYNKPETRPGRKMGHYTVIDDSVEAAIKKAEKLRHVVRIVPAT